MRAIRIRDVGGPDVLEPTDIDPPKPGDNDVLVEVSAAGVNYIDTYQRSGLYPVATPFVPGIEGAGTVRAVGSGVDGLAAGDRVVWKNALGSYAEHVVVPAHEAIPIPENVSDELAAALLLQGMTAHYLAVSTYPVQPGDWVIVHAAAGGVGLLLTQIAKLRGGHVLATVSTAEKAELATAAGADAIASYEDFAARATELTGGAGVACVYDGVGQATFQDSLEALRIRGTLALFGAASGPVPPVDPQTLNAKGSLFLTRPTLAHYTRDDDELRWRAHDLLRWAGDGTLDVRIGGRYPLAEARRAHEDLEGRKTTGKLLLLPA
nr:quinone oxidoreductase [Phytoactinopolyspora halophila]